MSKIEEMIKEMCPNGVKRVRLGEVCDIINGFAFQSKKYVQEGCRIIRISDVQSGFISDKDKVFYPENLIEEFKRRELFVGDLVMSLTGNPGRVALITNNNLPCALNQRVACLRCKNKCITTKYLFYTFNSPKFEEIAMTNSNGGGQKNLSTTWLGNYSLPLPPLAIQQEIVSVLDKFTDLISDIDKAIEQRQKQYEYYREKLLTFEEGECEWKKISDIGKLVRGNGLQKKDFVEEGTGCIHYGQIYTRLGFSTDKTLTFVPTELANKLTKVEPGNLVVACTSENVEDVCKSVVWLGNETIVTGGHACVFKHKEDPKYIGYCFLTQSFFKQKKQYVYGAKVIDIKTDSLGKIELPVPPLDRQRSIVATLDKFETAIADLKQMRELRQKQYEYYREKLLTF